MIENTLFRRLITIPVLLIAFALSTLLLPVLLISALIVDLVRYLANRTTAIAVRIVVFVWAYLLGEMWAVLALGLAGLFSHSRRVATTYRLQEAWTNWNFAWLRMVFSLRFEVEGLDVVAPAPILVLSRHASLVDSLLPARLIANRERIRLRYVLKRELLLDPALDIAGNRLPNYFVDRTSRENDSEISAIRRLGKSLTSTDGVVIFPEGTRFSSEKLARQKVRFQNRESDNSSLVESYRFVLAPRPAGTLALLDSTSCDVLVIAHHGLEGLALLVDIWSGNLVGSTVSVGLWRVPRSEIPDGRSDRSEWLYRIWADVDDWICRKVEE